MVNKWAVYAATYLTYSVVHSIRTCWASLKTVLIDEPFNFSEKYLGVLDMTVLFTIAVLLYIFGYKVEKHSRKKLLNIMMIGLIINLLIIFVLLLKKVNSQVVYFVFLTSTGILACLAWPICLFTVSQYFDSNHTTVLSMWSSVSQFGDFIAFLITLVVIMPDSIDSSYSMLILAIIFVIVLIYDYFFFREITITEQRSTIKQVQTAQNQVQKKQEMQENQNKIGSNSQMKESKVETASQPHIQNLQKPVNFLSVWLLPGVALPVLSFSTVKSINAIVVSWLVLYFTKIEMIKESRIIAIAWTLSIVLGGFIGSKLNWMLSYRIFAVCLFVSGFIFYLLEELHLHPNGFEVVALIVICGILVGGPYNQLGSAVPLKLSQDPMIRNRPNAKSTIISLMQSFAQFICGISILIVPSIGIMRLHYMAGALSFISVALLIGEQLRQHLKYRPLAATKTQNKQIPPVVQLKQEV